VRAVRRFRTFRAEYPDPGLIDFERIGIRVVAHGVSLELHAQHTVDAEALDHELRHRVVRLVVGKTTGRSASLSGVFLTSHHVPRASKAINSSGK